jgi:hypothetical protein
MTEETAARRHAREVAEAVQAGNSPRSVITDDPLGDKSALFKTPEPQGPTTRLPQKVWSAVYHSMRDEGVSDAHAMARADVVRIEVEKELARAAAPPDIDALTIEDWEAIENCVAACASNPFEPKRYRDWYAETLAKVRRLASPDATRWVVWDATTGLPVADFTTEEAALDYLATAGDENLAVSNHGSVDHRPDRPGAVGDDIEIVNIDK